MSIKDNTPHQKLILNVNSNNVLTVLEMKQGDKKSRYIDVTLVAAGESIDVKTLVGDGGKAFIVASMDNELRQNSEAQINTDGTILVEMSENALGEAGVLDCEIRLTDSSDSVLSSALFIVRVGRSAAGKNHKVLDLFKGCIKNKHYEDGSVSPEKLDREYWEKNVKATSITEYEELFETVGLVNEGGSIAQIAVDITTGTEGTVKGVCLAYGKRFANGDTVYLINTSTGEFWKVDRYIKNSEDGTETVSFKPERLTVTTDKISDGSVKTDAIADDAVTPGKLDRGYWEKTAIISDYVKTCEELFERVGFVNSGGTLCVVNVDVSVNVGETEAVVALVKGICYGFGVKYVNGDTVYLSNMTDGSFWKIDRLNEGTELVPVYKVNATRLDVIKEGAVTPDKLDRKYLERCVTEYGEQITSLSELVNKVGRFVNRGGHLGFVKLDITDVENINGQGYISGEFMAIGSLKSGYVYLVNLSNGDNWTVDAGNDGSYFANKDDGLTPRVEFLEESTLRAESVEEKGAEITLTVDQVYALDKMFELAAYKDEAVAEVYRGFVSAFGLDKYRTMRVIDGSKTVPYGMTVYADASTYKSTWYSEMPYTYLRTDANVNRTCYPYFDIPAEGGYSYQIYFEANEGVKISTEFYNKNALEAFANNENINAADTKSGYGWQDSMGFEWTPPEEVNGSPVKAFRMSFNSGDAGVRKIVVYRKKVV